MKLNLALEDHFSKILRKIGALCPFIHIFWQILYKNIYPMKYDTIFMRISLHWSDIWLIEKIITKIIIQKLAIKGIFRKVKKYIRIQKMHKEGFEPSSIATSHLECDPLDRSGICAHWYSEKNLLYQSINLTFLLDKHFSWHKVENYGKYFYAWKHWSK